MLTHDAIRSLHIDISFGFFDIFGKMEIAITNTGLGKRLSKCIDNRSALSDIVQLIFAVLSAGKFKILGGSGVIFLDAPSWDELIGFSYYCIHG